MIILMRRDQATESHKETVWERRENMNSYKANTGVPAEIQCSEKLDLVLGFQLYSWYFYGKAINMA